MSLDEGSVSHRLAPPKSRPDRGHYTSPSIGKLMELVCEQAQISVNVLRGTTQPVPVVHARHVVANVSLLIFRKIVAASVDEAMLRGSGWTIWARSRHRDRCNLFQEYQQFYTHCLLLAKARL